MNKKLKTLVTVVAITMCMSSVTFADPTLDSIINNQTVTEQGTTSEGTTSNSSDKSSFIEGLNQASDLTANVEKANKLTASAKEGAAFIVNILSYLIVLGVAIRVTLDLAYVTLPFTRGLLGKGASAPSNQPMGGMSSGFGGGGFGGGGFGGNSGGFGGHSGGFGGGGFGGGMGQQSQQQSPGVQWISNAAIAAVSSPNPFKTYSKDMMIVLIVTPILLVLAATGVLTSLGLQIGSLLVDFIQSVMGLM